MDESGFAKLKATIRRDLTAEQCVELAAELQRLAAERRAEVELAERARALRDRQRCPHCGGLDVVGHGRDRLGRQRWRCRPGGGCGRTFGILVGTPFSGMRMPEKWVACAEAMVRHVSVAKMAETLDVTRQTAWRWRQRFLRVPAQTQAATLGGVIEADETFFRSSYKGSRGWKRGTPPESRPPRYRGGTALRSGLSGEQIPVLTALDRGGGIVEAVLPARTRRAIEVALQQRIAAGSVLCSDGAKGYVEAAVAADSEHRRIMTPRRDWLAKAIGGKPRRKGRLGLGQVNAHHQRLKSFVNGMARGVSTRHLPLYLGWSRAIRSPDFDPITLVRNALTTTK